MADIETYLEHISSYFRGKPKFTAAVSAAVQPFVDAQNFLLTLPDAFDLDLAIGVQLDRVGLWVGETRYVNTPLENVYFSWSTPGLGWSQGNWQGPFDPTTGITTLDDESFRVLIRAKIAANTWDGTMGSLPSILAIVFPLIATQTIVFVVDHQDMSMTVAVAGVVPSAVVLALLGGGYIPIKPEAVRVSYIVTSVSGSPLFAWGVDNGRSLAGWSRGAWGVEI